MDFGHQEGVPLPGTCMHMHVCGHAHTHTHSLSLSLSYPTGKDNGGSGSELLHTLLKPHAEVGIQ